MEQGKYRKTRAGEAGIVKPSKVFGVKSEDMEMSLEDPCTIVEFLHLRRAGIVNLTCQPDRIWNHRGNTS